MIFANFPSFGKLKKEAKLHDYQPVLPSHGRLEDNEFNLRYLGIFWLLMFIIGGAFLLKLFDLQIIHGASHLYLAEGNRIRLQRILAPRGLIYDQYHRALVQNVLRYDLEIVPALFPRDETRRDDYLKKIADLTGIDLSDLHQRLEKNRRPSLDPIVLIEGLPQRQALFLEYQFRDMEGVEVSLKPLRRYESNWGLSHILGYIGKISASELAKNPRYQITDWIGKTGLEKVYDWYLRGQDGQRQIEVDARGRLQRFLSQIPPQTGKDLNLYLDLDLQKHAFEALQKKLAEVGSQSGVALAMDPRNGGILALVSLPDYDNNVFVKPNSHEKIYQFFNDKQHPLINRAIAGVYPTGSTIKPLVAALALQEKIISPAYQIDTPPEIKIGQWVFPDWKDHGLTDIRRAIAESNNIFFYMLGGGWGKIKGLGVNRLDEGLKKFNWGALTKIDLPGEKTGLIPTPAWKKAVKGEKWYLGDTYHLSIGQGDIGVTPIQLLTAISAIANRGTLYQPRLVQGPSKILRKNFIDQSHLKIVREGMKMAVESGSARRMQGIKDRQGKEIVLGAKTGTAQTGKKDKPHAWFVCFAPYQNPEIAIVVLVEHGGEGYQAALPVAKEMLEEYFSHR